MGVFRIIGDDLEHSCNDHLYADFGSCIYFFLSIGKLHRYFDGTVDMEAVDVPLHRRGELDKE